MTKQEHIDQAIDSMSEIPSSTRVRGWSFSFVDKYYVVLNFWMTPMGEHVGVYEANKKGKKLNNNSIVLLQNCKDPVKGIEALADLLIKEETETITNS
jgi:hypothetical protein